jgi:tRNA-splicing endonuclease subunit Sen54
LGLCVPRCTHERATGVRGDDWDARPDPGPIPRKVYAPRRSLFDIQRYVFCKTFSYLRRLGYVVTRATPPSPAYPVPAALALAQQPITASIFRRVFAALCSPISRLWSWFVQPSRTWWRPLVHRRWPHHNMDYREQIFVSDDLQWKVKYFLLASIFKTLRFLSSGHAVPLPSSAQCFTEDSPSPYEIFYHLYKPNTPYRKTAPPQPDFSIVVVK